MTGGFCKIFKLTSNTRQAATRCHKVRIYWKNHVAQPNPWWRSGILKQPKQPYQSCPFRMVIRHQLMYELSHHVNIIEKLCIGFKKRNAMRKARDSSINLRSWSHLTSISVDVFVLYAERRTVPEISERDLARHRMRMSASQWKHRIEKHADLWEPSFVFQTRVSLWNSHKKRIYFVP